MALIRVINDTRIILCTDFSDPEIEEERGEQESHALFSRIYREARVDFNHHNCMQFFKSFNCGFEGHNGYV